MMKRQLTIVVAIAAVTALCLVVYPVYAHCGKCLTSAQDMVKMMDSYKQTLGSAITSAESSTKGKALMARADDHEGKLTFNVWTLSGDKIMLARIDGGTGKIAETEEVKDIGAHKEHSGKKSEGHNP